MQFLLALITRAAVPVLLAACLTDQTAAPLRLLIGFLQMAPPQASPAVEAGIEPDDIIESLDRNSANETTLTQLRSMLTQPNARYFVGISSGEKAAFGSIYNYVLCSKAQRWWHVSHLKTSTNSTNIL
jgi:hypothetical protein